MEVGECIAELIKKKASEDLYSELPTQIKSVTIGGVKNK